MGLSYADAAHLMGGRESRTVAALDRLTGGLLLAASATGAGFALSLFDAKGDLARLSAELVHGLGERLRKLDRFSRSERLAAAHSVVALTAYFEVLANSNLPVNFNMLELTGPEQVALAHGGLPESNGLRALAAGLLRSDVPMPTPQRPYEVTVEAMRDFYERLSGDLSRFVTGLAVYEQLDETNRERFAETLSQELPGQAVIRYQELFRQLAVEFPEMAFWANLVDHQATRAEVRRISSGLEGLERMLTDIASGRSADERRSGLFRAYRGVLRRPVLTPGDVPEGLRLPTLGESYVNPEFRVAEASAPERLAQESWWEQQPVRDDLEGFLAGHLTAPQATAAPLLLLGQPGSGKSVLTQVLAARLPADEFLVVRVVLREVAADADLQTQIEDAVRSATGESLAWPDLARSAGDALLVVLADGFDELLQATGVSQSDYLKKVAAFQVREADQGRPVAVVVTSRTAVADRAQPVPGMVVLRLEPFSDTHISHWLSIWNSVNAAEFAARDMQPLALQTVLAHADLASQPLLLLMLALYDADANALQRSNATLGKAELYERLLTRFAEREIGKAEALLPAAEFADAVERELLRLSVVAFAMFSRGRQWVSETELNADLNTLLGPISSPADQAGLRARLSAAQVAVGRFFFVYEAQATRDNTQLKTYEFLHATFGEYLTARLVTLELSDLADAAQFAASRSRPSRTDDSFLYALLSFMPLTIRSTVVSFATERIRTLPESRRNMLGAVLLGLFRNSLAPRHGTQYSDYNPSPLAVPARHAAYSANLVVLTVLTRGKVTGPTLFPATENPVEDWHNLALLWRSQLPHEGWDGLIDTLVLDRIWSGTQRNITLRLSQEAERPPWGPDPLWDLDIEPGDEQRPREPDSSSIWGSSFYYGRLRDQARFTCDAGDDALIHALDPIAKDLDRAVTTFHSYGPEHDRAVSPVNALITLWLKSDADSSMDELVAAYDTCLKILGFGFSPSDTNGRERFYTLVLRQLAVDQHRLPLSTLELARTKIREAIERNWEMRGPILLRIVKEAFPELDVQGDE